MSQPDDLVGRRAELLARVVLTRRLNIDVFPLDAGGEMGIDYLCSIRDEKAPGFLPFGVLVWGTSEELNTPEDAAKHARARRKKLHKRNRYFIPVIILLFSMHRDEGFFSWLVEPCEDVAQLMDVAQLDFQAFTTRQLDHLIKRVTDWYKRLAGTVMADATSVGSSRCQGDE